MVWWLSHQSAAANAAATSPIAIDITVALLNKTKIGGRKLGAINPAIAGRYAKLPIDAAAVRPPTTKAMKAKWTGSDVDNRADPISPQKQPVAVAPTVKCKAQLAAVSADCGLRR